MTDPCRRACAPFIPNPAAKPQENQHTIRPGARSEELTRQASSRLQNNLAADRCCHIGIFKLSQSCPIMWCWTGARDGSTSKQGMRDSNRGSPSTRLGRALTREMAMERHKSDAANG